MWVSPFSHEVHVGKFCKLLPRPSLISGKRMFGTFWYICLTMRRKFVMVFTWTCTLNALRASKLTSSFVWQAEWSWGVNRRLQVQFLLSCTAGSTYMKDPRKAKVLRNEPFRWLLVTLHIIKARIKLWILDLYQKYLSSLRPSLLFSLLPPTFHHNSSSASPKHLPHFCHQNISASFHAFLFPTFPELANNSSLHLKRSPTIINLPNKRPEHYLRNNCLQSECPPISTPWSSQGPLFTLIEIAIWSSWFSLIKWRKSKQSLWY